ncbi:MAG: methionine--tRNA ligase [Dehalococcoidia bacterium]|nr:methionine--tRNA ligase [Dehalococcoidia bacterium]
MEKVFIGVAWPYANGPLHLGHLAGAYLPADIFARYHRMNGDQVLMVSGSDQHGTPITVRAEQEGKTPAEVAAFYHQGFVRSWGQLGISFDLFTNTDTVNHAEVTHDLFLSLYEKGHIYKDIMESPFCPRCKRYLPDRYVEGSCPNCGSTGARGDQCDECGKPLNPTDLISPRCKICGTTPETREVEHFFLRLTAFNQDLLAWVRTQTQWKPNVLNFTTRFLEEGLKDRAITRDIDSGVTIPIPGFDDKRIYVWFEAVIGYLSASKEWSQIIGQPEKWREFWQDPEAKSYYFIGKDNITFHTIMWPAMLMGYGGLNLPYDVPANEFLTLAGRQFSTSRNWAVWLPDYLERYDPDPLRYFLSISMPERADTDFSWDEFVRRNNDELVATYGNLTHRVLTFTYRHFDGHVPEAVLDERDGALLAKGQAVMEQVGFFLGQRRFREAIMEIMALAQEANRYLEEKSPWKAIQTDKAYAAGAMLAALNLINGLKTMLYPFLPFSSQTLHQSLGFDGSLENAGWGWTEVKPGQRLAPPKALFVKLDDSVVEAEKARLGQRVAGGTL